MGRKKIAIEEKQYFDFSLGLHTWLGRLRKPLNGHFDLTYRCNLNCIHCCTSCYNNNENIQKELSLKEIYNILDQIYDAGCLWLCFSGGEPLARSDFLDIYLYAKRKGFLITIFTNGLLFNPKMLKILLKYRPFLIEVTLHSLNASIYEAITRKPGSFKRCISNIEQIRKKKLPLTLKTVLMKQNYQELEKIKDYAKLIGAGYRYDTLVVPKFNQDTRPLLERLSALEVFSFLQGQKPDCEKINSDFKPAASKSRKLFSCAATFSSFHIDSYGKLSFCALIRDFRYDLKKGNFKEGFYSHIGRLKTIEAASGNSKCISCSLKPICRVCAAYAKLETGSFEAPVEYFCQMAKYEAGALTENIIETVRV